jgi:hypothetical protein
MAILPTEEPQYDIAPVLMVWNDVAEDVDNVTISYGLVKHLSLLQRQRLQLFPDRLLIALSAGDGSPGNVVNGVLNVVLYREFCS